VRAKADLHPDKGSASPYRARPAPGIAELLDRIAETVLETRAARAGLAVSRERHREAIDGAGGRFALWNRRG
jgi:hypothetical protein